VPNVQWKTPDDGQRRCPKHVEIYKRINLEIIASGWLFKKKCVERIFPGILRGMQYQYLIQKTKK